jgi:sialic acid synthase SpsE
VKIASHSFTNGPLLHQIAKLKLPVIASIGASTLQEQEKSLNILKDNPVVLMHCVSAYPTPDNMTTIDTITYLRERYKVPVGFSSHEVGIDISIAASVLGACAIERHFTMNRAMVGLDQPISLEPEEFSRMALIIRRLNSARGINKGLHDLEKTAKYNYHVSVCANQHIPIGTIISGDMLICKQPLIDPALYFTGLELDTVIGLQAKTELMSDAPILRTSVGVQ